MSTTDESSSSSSSVSATRLTCSRNVVDRSRSRGPRRRARPGSRCGPRPRCCARPRARPRSPTAARMRLEQLGRTGPVGQLGGEHVEQRRGTSAMPLTARPVTPASSTAAQRVDERHAVAVGPDVEPADGAVADAPLGHVEHPLDADLVERVDHRLQVGQRVLDLAPVVEAGAADDLVGDARAHELLFHDPALRVGAVEDGDVAPAVARRRAGGRSGGPPTGSRRPRRRRGSGRWPGRGPGRSTAPWACGRGCWR